MELPFKTLWVVLHGVAFGGGFAHAAALCWGVVYGARHQNSWARALVLGPHLRWSMWVTAAAAWVACISGTWVVYPWYRAKPGAGEPLSEFPRSLLLSMPETAAWHTFGMEWKEHVSWLTPLAVTAAAVIVHWHPAGLLESKELRRGVLSLVGLAIGGALVAGLFGAAINNLAPVR